MSNKHIENLTVRLLQALDKNYDVVNMDAVLSVIAALENTKITKEQLEATRLAKYINLFRRRTKSEQLAKRAKSLLKKWREMVGMQQRPLGICNELIRNESTTNSNFQESGNFLEVIPSHHQIPSISHTGSARNAYSGSSTPEKFSENHKNSVKVITSFSNVLAGFSGANDKNNPPSCNTQVANGPSSRRKNNNTKRNDDSKAFLESFPIELESDLGCLESCTSLGDQSKFNSISEPIIIDIEDSNSGSNLIGSALSGDKEIKVISSPLTEKPYKHKKAKKDKKRARDRDFLQDISTPLVVIDAESSLSQQPGLRKQAERSAAEKETDEKNFSENLMVTNISEVLSLSNSSMSSVFPTSSVGATKNLFSQSNRPLSESDLSFAGKFAQQNMAAVSSSVSVMSTNTEIKNRFLPYKDVNETHTTTAAQSTKAAFQPFTGTSCNSNESASNSRHSAFEIIDCSSQGNKSTSIAKPAESDLAFITHRPKMATSNYSAVEGQLSPPISSTTQPLPSNSVVSLTSTSMPEQKVPKKRGRKKGSKGIDSLIAKDTSLASQMLIQSLGSGGKKVKTTKELYAEMQNRKLGVSTPTTPSHWTSAQSQTFRRDSFCSEPSLHSPRTFDACSTNATVSATSSTPEKILVEKHTAGIDSGSDSLISGGQSRQSPALEPIIERTENLQNADLSKLPKEMCKKQYSSNMLTAVQIQLRELLEKLPPVPSLEKINFEMTKDAVPCTCKIFEVLDEKSQLKSETSMVGNLLSLEALETSNITEKENDQPIITISMGTEANDPQSTKISSATNNPAPSNVCEKPIRSIFDLDFDDDEDPLQTLKAEVAAAGCDPETEDETINQKIASPSKSANSRNAAEFSNDQNSQVNLLVDMPSHLTSHEISTPAFAFPIYKIEEDEACSAKQRFHLQVQKVTNFHICALHNFYIPNVNGNWDSATTLTKDGKGSQKFSGQTLLADANNVVPTFSLFDSEENIKKDLRKVKFNSNFKPKPRLKAVEKFFYDTPFLGVSRCLKKLKSSHRKTRKHRQFLESEKKEICNFLVNHLTEIDKKNITNEVGASLPDSFAECDKGTKSFSQCRENINNKSFTSMVYNDITINVGERLSPKMKEISPAESHTLLAIASNVNFNNNQIENNVETEHNTTEKYCYSNLTAVTDNSSDLNLKFGDDRVAALRSDKADITNNNNGTEKIDESSCDSSHCSLKHTQKSINLKLRKHSHQIFEQEENSSKSYSKRKRRRKKSTNRDKRSKITCIKIAINGGITTSRHVRIGVDDSESDSQASNSDVTDMRATHDRDEEGSDISSDIEVQREVEMGERQQKKGDDTNSDHEFVDDEEGYEYDDEFEEEDEYSGEFHEVVTRDISPSTESGNNHIVLTIKKTPSKTNSPCSSFPSISPVVSERKTASNPVKSDTIEEKAAEKSKGPTTEEGRLSKIVASETQVNSENIIIPARNYDKLAHPNLFQKYMLRHPTTKRKRRLLKRKSRERTPFRFLDEDRHEGDTNSRVFKKLHQQLFFPHEIFQETTTGSKECLFAISSCSSSCAELSEYENESSSSISNSPIKKSDKIDHDVNNRACQDTVADFSDGLSTSSESTSENSSEEIINVTTGLGQQSDDKSHKNENENEDKIEDDKNEILPADNNGLLESFNSDLVDSISIAKILKCDEICSKDLGNEDNFADFVDHEKKSDLVISKTEAIERHDPQPLSEHCTASQSNEDLVNDEGDGGQRPQQFKEWHQLLQLKSYNDELLTVLPYVVLE